MKIEIGKTIMVDGEEFLIAELEFGSSGIEKIVLLKTINPIKDIFVFSVFLFTKACKLKGLSEEQIEKEVKDLTDIWK